MDKTLVSLSKMILILILIVLGSFKAYGEESESILQQIKILQQDIKTLERAV